MNSIQINGGKYRGKKIYFPNTPNTRPSKSIVRNSIFDTLQNQILHKTFLELFAGSGSVGFEAISRGADEVLFFEKGREAISTLFKNRDSFSEKINVIEGDTFKNFSVVLNLENRVFYVDPPFNIRDGMVDIYQKSINLFENIEKKESDILIFEHISTEKFPDKIGDFEKYKFKKFGKTSLSYYL
jgi:16S rRNA (guanine(966)-N(2))-methyltransferase RsmD